jgi:hypothetical protein
MINGREFISDVDALRKWVNSHIAKYTRGQMSPEQIQDFKVLFNLEVLHHLIGLQVDENDNGELSIALPYIGGIAGDETRAKLMEMIKDVDSVIFTPYCEQCEYAYKNIIPYDEYNGTEEDVSKYMLHMLTAEDFDTMYDKAKARRNRKRLIVGGASIGAIGIAAGGYFLFKKYFG